MLEGPSEHPSVQPVLTILGLDALVQPDLVTWEVVTPESRHGIWRLRIAGDTPGPSSYVVKCYHHLSDRFFDHRFRREERTLNLLGRIAPGVAPMLHGGAITERHSAVIVMEDLGDLSLHLELEGCDTGAKRRLLGQAIDLLVAFHRATDEHSRLFRALIYSSDLDRINAGTMLRRFNIGLARCAGSDASGLPKSTIDSFERQVVRPLLSSPRRVIHNSFSPLNICCTPRTGLKLVDMETLSIGPREFDLAELLSYPGANLGRSEGSQVARYTAAMEMSSEQARDFRLRLDLAAVARSVDYAGTLSRRYQRFESAGIRDLAISQLVRRQRYLEGAARRAARAGLHPELAGLFRRLADSAPALRQ